VGLVFTFKLGKKMGKIGYVALTNKYLGWCLHKGEIFWNDLKLACSLSLKHTGMQV
jgi:hypothetical protein